MKSLFSPVAHSIELASATTNAMALLWWGFVLLIAPGYYSTNITYLIMRRTAPVIFYIVGAIVTTALIILGLILGSYPLRIVGKAAASFAWGFAAYSLFFYQHDNPDVAIYSALVIGNIVAVIVLGRSRLRE